MAHEESTFYFFSADLHLELAYASAVSI
ncbi:hypothetical protein HKBW3S06_01558, partial [Candidatus Hakubella thermalkaliphila]